MGVDWLCARDDDRRRVRGHSHHGGLGARHAWDLPPRPDRFALDEDDCRFLSCLGFEGWSVVFTDRGQAVRAFVKLGPGTRKSDAEVPDRLVIG